MGKVPRKLKKTTTKTCVAVHKQTLTDKQVALSAYRYVIFECL